ncbi:RNA-binding motif protein, X-linked 2 isoform X1 [Crotalus tigris]|uniref:RNA-binding motif protein, X-linked 2 isoform X1 n=1 Tax=Crotalus tigris TaxID=88082 RepID=UPI00192F8BDE|nr:RNA-binding motif protein, X-linked 2 isoform X1 [Crotalus tigris]
MNPLTKVKLINELNQREAELGVQDKVSWHAEYSGSAWVFVGGLPYELTEGDIICVFSQYGEIVNINLVRDKKTGKSKGFCFICYEDQRSTILAVDNFNGIKIKGRTIRVDHVANYRPPKDSEDIDEITKGLREKGCGVKTPPQSSAESPEEDEVEVKRHKKEKKKKKKKEKRAHRKHLKEESGTDVLFPKSKIKVEKEDPDYERYAGENQETWGSTSGHQHQSRMPPGQELRYERGVERSGERGSERDRYERRMPPSEEKHKKTEAIKDRQHASESRSRDRSKNREKSSREKSSSHY